MKTIYKFRIPKITDDFGIEMPFGAKILTVQTQHELPCIWAIVDTENGNEMRNFKLYGTGHPIETSLFHTYIGTFQLRGGDLVFHLFEVMKEGNS